MHIRMYIELCDSDKYLLGWGAGGLRVSAFSYPTAKSSRGRGRVCACVRVRYVSAWACPRVACRVIGYAVGVFPLFLFAFGRCSLVTR